MRVVQGYRPVIVDDEEDQTEDVINISDSSSDERIISEDRLQANTVKRRKIDHGKEIIVTNTMKDDEEEK